MPSKFAVSQLRETGKTSSISSHGWVEIRTTFDLVRKSPTRPRQPKKFWFIPFLFPRHIVLSPRNEQKANLVAQGLVIWLFHRHCSRIISEFTLIQPKQILINSGSHWEFPVRMRSNKRTEIFDSLVWKPTKGYKSVFWQTRERLNWLWRWIKGKLQLLGVWTLDFLRKSFSTDSRASPRQ